MRNLQKLKAINIFLLLLLISCQKEIIRPEFSRPNTPKKINLTLDKHTKRIVIATTNNFNSSVSGITESTFSQAPIAIGGADFLPSYLEILRKEYKDEVLLVDAGYFVNSKKNPVINKRTMKLYEILSYDAILLSENEILNLQSDHGIQLPFVNSNVIDLKENRITNKFGSTPYIIKKVNGVRVAIVGISIYKSKLKTEDNISGLLFDDPVASLITMRSQLKKKSDIILALVHMQTKCSTDGESDLKECPDNNEKFKKLVKRFPPNLVDVIIGGDSNYGSEFIQGIPVIQNFGHGKYLGQLDLYYDTKAKKLINSNTKIYPPLKLCSRFYKSTQDCHVDKDHGAKRRQIKESRYQLDVAKFLNSTIVPSLDIVNYLKAN